MNDDRKFQKIAEKAKILFEHDISYEIMAAVLNISPATAANYKRRVEKKYRISLDMRKNKKGLYSRLLKVYTELYPQAAGFSAPAGDESRKKRLGAAQSALFAAAGIYIDIAAVKNAAAGAILFANALRVPKITAELSPKMKRYAAFLSEPMNLQILDPTANVNSIREPFSEIMQAVADGKIKTEGIGSASGFITRAMEFLANEIEREELTTLTLDENAFIAAADRALAELTRREAEVARLFFGLDGEKPLTLEEIGEKFDLTRERARMIKEKALRRLRFYSRIGIVMPIVNCSRLIKFQAEKLAEKDKALAGKDKEIMALAETLDKAKHIPVENIHDDLVERLATPLADLGLSKRAYNCLRGRIDYLYELAEITTYDILKFRNLGSRTFREIEALLSGFGLEFGMNITESSKCRIKAVIARKKL